jgi:hypothetical protein
MPHRFTPEERDLGTHWIGLIAGLDDVEKRKFLTHQDSNSEPSVVQPVDNRYIDCAIPRFVGYAKRMGEKRNAYRVWRESQKEMYFVEDIEAA